MKNSFYITTTLPYVNADPHIGFAREVIQADVLARHQRLLGKEVFFNTGTDEHGQKVMEKAKELGKEPQQYADEIVENWKKLKTDLDLSYDKFIRTTDEHHIKAAQRFWKICDENGFIYKKKYKARYCVGCELTKTDSELDHGQCPDHPGKPLETIEEENYFFKFSNFQKELLELYKNKSDFVKPTKRFKEINSFVESRLEDFSISRLKEKMPWGIEVPNDSDHVMYVWFDALVDYISTLGWPDGEKFEKFWNNSEERIQFCGKDNLRQQSAMWQSMLMAAKIKNSSKVFVNGFINVDGQKMSKTLGNVISPDEMVKRYGTDGTRYLLLSMGSFGEDTVITWKKLDEKYNADLANGLGNLLSRVITLYQKIEGELDFTTDKKIIAQDEIRNKNIEDMSLGVELGDVWASIRAIDKTLEKEKPWELIKKDKQKFKEILQRIIWKTRGLYFIANQLEIFMPETSKKIQKALETKEKIALFPRIDA